MAYDLVAGDTGSALTVTLRNNSDQSLVDLTSCTAALNWLSAAGAVQTRAMTVVGSPTLGVVNYAFILGTDLEAGTMDFEVRVSNALGRTIHTLDLIRVPVRQPIAA